MVSYYELFRFAYFVSNSNSNTKRPLQSLNKYNNIKLQYVHLGYTFEMGKLNYNVNNNDFFKWLFYLAKSKRKKCGKF